MTTNRQFTFASLLWLLITASSTQAAFLQGHEITVRWLSHGSPIAETNFIVDSQSGAVEVAGFPSSGGPVSIDVQEADDAHATVLIRWTNDHATGIENYLEVSNLPSYSHLFLGAVNWLGVDDQSLHQSTNAFTFHVGAYPGLNAPTFSVRIDLVRVQVAVTGSPSSEGLPLSVSGKAGESYQLQATTDLASGAWTNVASFTMSTGATNILDTSATNFAHRFYRVVSP